MTRPIGDINPFMAGLFDRTMESVYSMPSDQAKATVMKFLGEMPDEQIATDLEITPEQSRNLALAGLRQISREVSIPDGI